MKMKILAISSVAALFAITLGIMPAGANINGFAKAARGTCNLSYVNSQIKKYKAIKTWTAPGPAFDAKKASGKSIYTIQENTANPFSATIVQGIKDAAALVGITVTDYPNQGDKTQWIQGIQQAITAKADGIIFVGGTIGPKYFQTQAEQAQAAGLKLVTVVDTDLTQAAEPATDARVAQPYAEAARLSADWIISDTKCKANVLMLTTNDLIAGDINTKAARDEFKKYCGSGCKIKETNFPISAWASGIQPVVQSSIQANKKLNYIFPLYDAMVQFVTPAIQLAGANARVKITSFNGTPAILKMIDGKGPVKSIIGENEAHIGFGAIDQMARLLTGNPPIKSGNENIPLRIFWKGNVAEAGVPTTYGIGYGDKWKTGYLKLWRIK